MSEYIFGTLGDDLINGTDLNDRIKALLGDDVIVGNKGDDFIYADATENPYANPTSGGNDTVFGGEGRDTVFGGLGDDVIDGQEDNDILWGDTNLGRNRNNGGNDLIYGGAGDDTLDGMVGDDTLYGGTGRDRLLGERGNDELYGEEGNDILNSGHGSDTLMGGAGNDRLYATADVLDWYATAYNYLDGGDGDDYLWGSNDYDTLIGGAGNDFMYDYNPSTVGINETVFMGGDGNDKIFSYRGSDIIFAGRGANTIQIKHNRVAGQVTINLDRESVSNEITYLYFDEEIDIIRNFVEGRDSFVLPYNYTLQITDLSDGTQLASAVNGGEVFDFAHLQAVA
ncbi:MAG: calcium-binding protein [Crocosphaera sp.]|nr:calcium-binding protein [Crocosphaera sp.]